MAVVPVVSLVSELMKLLPTTIAMLWTRTKTRVIRPSMVIALAAVQCLMPLTGCHRQFYRKQADMEVEQLIAEKACSVARPPTADLGIEIDRRSRMHNPFDPDFQPMPLDDPASHKYMQCVDGRRGYPMWDAAGLTNTQESPDWWEFLPLDEDGVLVLNSENSVRLALLHSTDYQEQLESLYLAALDVSSERFRFDTQWFSGQQAFLTANGRDRNNGESSTTFGFSDGQSVSRTVGMSRTLATGGTLVANLANSITWQLSGPNSQAASTVLDFSIIQPLLQGGGRDVVLERLTRAERNLLANVRAFERYRRNFYLNITVGRGLAGGVQRSGGVFGVGLGGFNGLGGGFAGVGGGGGGGGGAAGGGFVPQAGGLLGLLQDQLQIRNLEENIARLSENLLILENTLIELLTTIPDDPEAIVRQRLQVAQARTALLNAQSGLVQRQVGYQSSLDSFLQQLGLPPYLCVRIEDPILERFELIDRDLRGRREQLSTVRADVGNINVALLERADVKLNEETGLPESNIEWSPQISELLKALQDRIEPLAEFNETLLEDDLPRIQADLDRYQEVLPERREQNENLYESYQRDKDVICSLLNVNEIDESIFEIDELAGLVDELGERFQMLQEHLESYEERIEELDESIATIIQEGDSGDSESGVAARIRDEVILASQDLLAELGDDVLSLQLIQARARTESVLLPAIDIDPATAFQIARKNRRDWANARAGLVDSWRSIEFIADDLESTLDVVFSGDLGSGGNSPLDFRASNGQLRAGLRWDAPITRLQERNTYRQSLIEFDQQRRAYYQFEDGIWSLLRGTVRQLGQNQLNFELGRQSVRIAAAQIELNEDIRQLRDARGLSSGPTAARDTITALDALLDSQNALLDIYVNYEVVRQGLFLDLGTMELTADGLWMDPGELDTDMLLSLPGTSNPNLCGCCEEGCCIPIRRQPIDANYGYAYGPMVESEVILSDVPVAMEIMPMESMPVDSDGIMQYQDFNAPVSVSPVTP